MRTKFLSTILLFAVGFIANAQTLQQWTWDTYKIKFKAPDNLSVKKNDATIYEAGNSSMYLDIYPRSGENLTYDGMKNSLIKWAGSIGLA
jgi:Dihydro-orotase-like